MKKIIITNLLLATQLFIIAQVSVPQRIDTLFSGFTPLYLSDFHVKKLPCNYGISHSVARSNVFGQELTGNNLGISLNYPDENDMYRPKGVFRLYNYNNNTSKFFYATSNKLGISHTEKDTISIHNSTFANGKFLLSGTYFLYPDKMVMPMKGGSWGFVGMPDLANNVIKYFKINTPALTLPIITGNGKGVDIIDATYSSNDGYIYAVGFASSSPIMHNGRMFLCKIDPNIMSTQYDIYPLQRFDPSTGTYTLIEEVQPHKIFIDNEENLLYVIGTMTTNLPPALGGTRTQAAFVVKYDLNSRTALYKNFIDFLPGSSGSFFDMKKMANGNYIVGYNHKNCYIHGYIELDINLNLISQEMFDATSIHSGSNIYTKGNNDLMNYFGRTLYSDIHLPDNDNVHFYGWNANGMAFANIYKGANSISAPSNFYGILLGNNYLTADNPSIYPLFQYQPFTTSQWKFQVYPNGNYTTHRKSMAILNGNYQFFASLPEPDSICSSFRRKDRILTRSLPLTFAYSGFTQLQSNFLQYVYSTPQTPSAGSYQNYEGLVDTCFNSLPIDYFSNQVPLQLLEYETFVDGLSLSQGEQNTIDVIDENIDWIDDNLTDCNISNNVQYYQKSAQSARVQNSKILSIEIFDVVGRSLNLNFKEYIGQKYTSSLEKNLISQLEAKTIYFINIVTEHGVNQLKISKE